MRDLVNAEDEKRPWQGPRLPQGPEAWWLAGAAITFLILLSHVAADVLAIVALCAVVFAIERTVGDWLTDLASPFVSKFIFVAGACCAVWILFSFSVVRDFLDAADKWGFHSALIGSMSVPAAPPVSFPASGGSVPSPDLPLQGSAAGAARPSDSPGSAGPGGRPLMHTRVVLRLGGQGGAVLLQVDVVGEASAVNEGTVEFSIDGRPVGTARVADGRAETYVTNVARGAHRARARFTGSGHFAEAASEAAFAR